MSKILNAIREMQIIEINDSIFVNGNINNLTKGIRKLLDLKIDNKFLKNKLFGITS